MTIGGRQCSLFLETPPGSGVWVNATGPQSSQIISSPTTRSADGVDLWTFAALVPPGQGKTQGVVVTTFQVRWRGLLSRFWFGRAAHPRPRRLTLRPRVFRLQGSAQTSSDAGFTIKYKEPVLTSVVVTAADGSNTTFPIFTSGSVKVPTTGAVVTLIGSNLGDAPDFVAGPSMRTSLTPCPGVSDHTCYVGVTLPGEGDGLQSDLGSAFTKTNGFYLVLMAADQNSQTVSFSYLPPAITRVAPASTLGLPTAGGAPLSITGVNFGTRMSASSSSFLSVSLLTPAALVVSKDLYRCEQGGLSGS